MSTGRLFYSENAVRPSGKFYTCISMTVTVLALIFSISTIYVAVSGVVSELTRNVLHLSLVMMILFLRQLGDSKRSLWQKVVDILFLAGSVSGAYYVLDNMEEILTVRGAVPNNTDIIMGAIFIFCLLEATRRVTGLILPGLVVFFLLYMRFGYLIPGTFSHSGFSWERIIFRGFLTNEGIWGTTIAVSSTYIALFVIFASLLEKSGAAEFFTSLALLVSMGRRASAAWAAAVGSALMGTISGSAAANVVTTGSITIPLMKKVGFTPAQAGGIEAAASTGGMLMPPVMGAAAFLIPGFLGVSFLSVIKAAFVPAILYYITILINIELISAKLKFTPIAVAKVETIKLLNKGLVFLLPLAVLIATLLMGRSPSSAAITSMTVLLAFVFVKERSLARMKFVISALESAAHSMVQIAIVCGVAGLIVQTITSTGIASVLGYNLKTLTAGNPLLMLILLALLATLLSMGMPATALYIVLASTFAPAISALGMLPLAVHLFLFWYGCISAITPPVAVASYAAAGIANANVWALSKEAFRFGIVGWVVPFVFVFSPSLLLLGDSYLETIIRIVMSTLGFFAISVGLQGWYKGKISFFLRVAWLIAGSLMLTPVTATDLVGILMLVVLATTQFFLARKPGASL